MSHQTEKKHAQRRADEFCQQFHLRVFALYFFSAITLFNFLAGFLFLILRQLRFDALDFIGFALTGIPLSFMAALALANRRKISREKAIAVIDSFNCAGGLAIASAETGDDSWSSRLPTELKLPTLTASFDRRLPVLLLSLVFLLAGMKMPLYDFSRSDDPTMDLKGLKERAILQIETLEETGVLTHQESQELKETVEKMVKAADKNDPAKTFEAFDQMNDKLRKEGATAAQKAARSLNELEKLQHQAEMLDKARNGNELKTALNNLRNSFSSSEAARQMSSEKRNSINKGLEAVNQDGSPSKDALSQASGELQQYIEQKAREKLEMAKKLRKVMVIDQKTFEQLKKEGLIKPLTDPSQLNDPGTTLVAPEMNGSETCTASDSASTKQNGQGKSAGDKMPGQSGSGAQPTGDGPSGSPSMGMNSLPGNAGVSRGGGSAPLNFNRKSSEHRIKYIDQKLPDPLSLGLEDAVTIGAGVSAPEVEDGTVAEGQTSAAQRPERSSGRSDVILPKHRNAVKNFFDR